MKSVNEHIEISSELYQILADSGLKTAQELCEDIASLARKFSPDNENLLKTRDDLQNKINSYFSGNKNPTTLSVVKMLEDIGYIKSSQSSDKVAVSDIAEEISPNAGPQLVVPADKVNMVLNAANARWESFYNAVYTSNIIDSSIENDEDRRRKVIEYTNIYLQNIIPIEGVVWDDIVSFYYNNKGVFANSENEESISLLSCPYFIGYTLNEESVDTLIFEHNRLKIEVVLKGGKIDDVLVEAALTYIIDLEDASISAPDNKYESYRIIKGIADGTLECQVRGQVRKMECDTTYICAKTGDEKLLKRTALPLVRDVGPHMMADEDIITVDGEAIPEKILDMYVTSLLGMRYHVAPKMHGSEEVKWNVRLWDEVNKLQQLPENANKIGIMNEEMRTDAQLEQCVLAAKDIVFFTNTGFLDYTGSFIDLMMHQGAIAPYRELPSKIYKTAYERHNVNVSLALGVPQIGAGMWPAIKDMAGLLKSKESQVKGLTDTSWSPYPMAAAIHSMAFHLFGDVRQMQKEYAENIKAVNINDLFEFPKADIAALGEEEIIENLDFATHGLLAYAEPWVRRGIGCSGVKDLSGEPLMEDRATARIKAAFIRNWLLHGVIDRAQVEDSLKRMANIVNEQNKGEADYINIDESEQVYKAVSDVIFNPQGLKASYVEPYFYAAYKKENAV